MTLARRSLFLLVSLAACALSARPAHASFHLMQIEQVIGGVNGDVSAQAIQLRMRSGGQFQVSNSRVKAWDAAGLNPILIVDMTTNVASPGAVGDHVLITSTAFQSYVSPVQTPNFTMTNVIPASYLAAGSLTFEDDFGSIYWRLSWGGAAYTGPGTVIPTPTGNDANGNANPPFSGPLPYTTLQALRFINAAGALSTTNAADYALTPGASVWTNNAGLSETLVGLPGCSVYAGIDIFTTPPGGGTYEDFSAMPIPAGFFGPGSDPFGGFVIYRGQPLAPASPLGPTDTIVRRTQSASLPTLGSSATVPIEIVALSLVSVNPITVTYNGGQNPEPWTVSVCLSSSAPQPQGQMTIRASACACPEGGTFSSILPVLPRLTFSRIGPPVTQVLDFGALAIPPIQFQCLNGHWTNADPGGLGLIAAPAGLSVDHDCNAGTPLVTNLQPTTNFHPGVRIDRCASGSCAGPTTTRKRMTQEQAASAAHGILPTQTCLAGDGDSDGICDDADNCLLQPNPLQLDQDDDGIGDGCDNCLAVYNPCQEDADHNGIGDACQPTGVVPPPTVDRVELEAPRPNPASGAIEFGVSLPREAHVRVAVYALDGRHVRTLVDRVVPAGVHPLSWDARDENGTRVSVGGYYLRLEADGVRRSRSVMVIR